MAGKPDGQPQAQNPDAVALQDEFDRGMARHQQGRLAAAESSFLEILRRQPNHFAALHMLGIIAFQTGHTERSVELIGKAIELDARVAAAHSNLGNALSGLKRSADALVSYDRAIALKPDFAVAHNNRGSALTKLKRLEEALASFDKAIALNPDYAEAHNNRGSALNELKHHEEALANFDKAIALKPDFVEAHNNRGNALTKLIRLAEALASFDKAIALNPGYAEAHNNRGNALSDLKKHEEALTSLDKAIGLNPDFATAHYNRGNALWNLRCPAEAIASYHKAIALNLDIAEAYWNLSLCLLLLGRFEQGWRQYEWRKKVDEPIAARSFAQPLWLGEQDIAGKTLFLWWEQGFGDTIQFSRYAKLVEARGAKVIMSVQAPLRGLLNQISPTIEFINPDEVPADFNYHCPLLSLPLAFDTTLEAIPAQQPRLKADEQLRLTWAARLPPKTKPRIGLVWSGTTLHKGDHNRSMELRQFLPILTSDADWICLQKEIRAKDLAVLQGQLGRIAYFGDELKDFSDTAALLDQLELVITVDTSVAHLAGAMDKPVWVLLPYNPDWRWLLDRNDSPWYPSARLFRQNATRTWDDVIARVQAALGEFIVSRQ